MIEWLVLFACLSVCHGGVSVRVTPPGYALLGDWITQTIMPFLGDIEVWLPDVVGIGDTRYRLRRVGLVLFFFFPSHPRSPWPVTKLPHIPKFKFNCGLARWGLTCFLEIAFFFFFSLSGERRFQRNSSGTALRRIFFLPFPTAPAP